MKQAEIQSIQKTIGVEPDGWWGPKSIAACQKHLRALMPKPNPWPKSDQASLQRFYGSPGGAGVAWRLENVPVPYRMTYAGQIVKTIAVHEKLAASLERILLALKNRYTPAQRAAIGVDLYYGCYANRKMRGGSLPSMHARAAAVDFDAGRNGLRTHWPTRATMPLGVMEEFAMEGWLSAGAFWSRDAMHFQASQ